MINQIIQVTPRIKRIVGEMVASNNYHDAEEMLTALTECSIIDVEYPGLFDCHGNFNETLNTWVNSAVIQEIQLQMSGR